MRFAFAPVIDEGAVVVERTTFAAPPAALAADEVIVRPVAATASETNMDERRRTQNSCGWSDKDNPQKRDFSTVNEKSSICGRKVCFFRRKVSPRPVQRRDR